MSGLEAHKSQIAGVGFGSTHCWIRDPGITEDSQKRPCNYYTCGACGEGFVHYYMKFADIFASLRADGVHERCPRQR